MLIFDAVETRKLFKNYSTRSSFCSNNVTFLVNLINPSDLIHREIILFYWTVSSARRMKNLRKISQSEIKHIVV